eukprot:scaffold44985_cov68-Phaeocystis_antarctica.AAC.2
MPRWQSKECVRCGPRRYHSVSSLKPQPLARIRTSLQPLALTMGMADSPARALLCGVWCPSRACRGCTEPSEAQIPHI